MVKGTLVAVRGTFTPERLDAIAAVVANETGGLPRRDRRLLSIEAEAAWMAELHPAFFGSGSVPVADIVQVQTGYLCGLLCGSGYTYVLQEVDGRWVVVWIGAWES
jgi:hypothetical protein